MRPLRSFAIVTLVAPLALTLSACGSDAGSGAQGATSGEPIAPIAAPAGSTWSEMVTVSDSDGYILGNPDAPIKLIEYASLTCGACANFAATGVTPLKADYVDTGRVSYELRNQVHNAPDLVLARLVRCGAPESFHPLSDQVWANLGALLGGAQQNGPALEAAMQLPENQRFSAAAQAMGFLDFFAARGLSRDQAQSCLADPDSLTAIAERSDAQSAELGINATPTFILNGTVLEERTWPTLEPLLQKAGAR